MMDLVLVLLYAALLSISIFCVFGALLALCCCVVAGKPTPKPTNPKEITTEETV